MADRAHLQVHGIEAAEGALDPGQLLVAAPHIFRCQIALAGADHVQAVQGCLVLDRVRALAELQTPVSELGLECLPTLERCLARATSSAMAIADSGFLVRGATSRWMRARSSSLGHLQQRFALVPRATFPRRMSRHWYGLQSPSTTVHTSGSQGMASQSRDRTDS